MTCLLTGIKLYGADKFLYLKNDEKSNKFSFINTKIMKAIKIFEDLDTIHSEELEKEINEWLEDNNVDILQLTQSVILHKDGRKDYIISLLYEKS